MRSTRKQNLARMAAILEAWAAQIADLQAKASTAGSSAAVFRDMLLGAERIAGEFRKLYVQASSRFAT